MALSDPENHIEAIQNGVVTAASDLAIGGIVAGIARLSSKALNKIENEVFAKLSGMLRDALKGKGNFGLGKLTSREADEVGKAWVGEGYSVASDGKTLVSKDKLRQYRPTTTKKKSGRIQANLESRNESEGQWQSNGHIDIDDEGGPK